MNIHGYISVWNRSLTGFRNLSFVTSWGRFAPHLYKKKGSFASCYCSTWLYQEKKWDKIINSNFLNLNICKESYPGSLGWLGLLISSHHYFIMMRMKVSSLLEYVVIIADEVKCLPVTGPLHLWHVLAFGAGVESLWDVTRTDHTGKCEQRGY